MNVQHMHIHMYIQRMHVQHMYVQHMHILHMHIQHTHIQHRHVQHIQHMHIQHIQHGARTNNAIVSTSKYVTVEHGVSLGQLVLLEAFLRGGYSLIAQNTDQLAAGVEHLKTS